MKRVLLVTYVFPPDTAAGALRPSFMARYFPEFGWEATVLTRMPGEPGFPARVVSTGELGSAAADRVRESFTAIGASEYSKFRSALRGIKDALLFPDRCAGWIPPAVRCGMQLLREQRYDAILGTALPASVHVAGGILARRSGIPWVADYRDPWAGNQYVRLGPIRKFLEETFERRLLLRASAITAISEPIAQRLRAFHRRSDVVVIPNAYDPALWNGIPASPANGFELCYTGSMYEGKRSPDMLFEALRELRSAGDPIANQTHVHFYGPYSTNVDASARRFGIESIVTRHGTVPREEAMRAQRSAAALLIFLNMNAATTDEMGSKFLEYIGARRPILAFGPPGSVMRDVIERNNLGWFVSSVEQARAALQAAYARYAAGDTELTGDIRGFPDARELARRFAGMLDRLAR